MARHFDLCDRHEISALTGKELQRAYVDNSEDFRRRALCGIWPHRDLGAGFRAPVRTRHPVLIIHGDRDTSTPIENAREVAAALPNARLVEVRGGSHGAIYNLYQRWPPMRERLTHFLAGGDADFPMHITLESGTGPDHASSPRSTP